MKFINQKELLNFPKELLNREVILNLISEKILWQHYVGHSFEINKLFSATYREDKIPSFIVKESKSTKKLIGRDYGTGFYGDIFDYVQMIFKLENLTESLKKITKDFKLYQNTNLEYESLKNLKGRYLDFNKKTTNTSLLKIIVKKQNFTEKDLEYWSSYGISLSTLQKFNVYSAKKIILVYANYTKCIIKPISFAYYYPKTGNIKCYLPFEETSFIGNINSDLDIDGLDLILNIEYTELIILTKSKKDVMLLYEYGIPAISFQSETKKIQMSFITFIKTKCKNLISLYDRDVTGVTNAKVLWKQYKIIPELIDKKYNAKDISDLYKLNRDNFFKFLNNLKKKYNV